LLATTFSLVITDSPCQKVVSALLCQEFLELKSMAISLDLPEALIGLPGSSYFLSFRKAQFVDSLTRQPVATVFLPDGISQARKDRFLNELARIDPLINLDFDISPYSTQQIDLAYWKGGIRGGVVSITQKSDPDDFRGSPGYEDTFSNIYLNLDILISDVAYGDTLIHEFGHAIGLIHPWEDGGPGGESTTIDDPNRFTDEQTVMAYRSLDGLQERFRDADIQALRLIWGPEDIDPPLSPRNLGPGNLPVIGSSTSGLFEEGVTLRASVPSGDPDGDASDANPAFQWYLNGVEIKGATAEAYSVPAAGAGDYAVEVTYSDAQAVRSTLTSALRRVFPVNAQPLQLDAETTQLLYVAYYGRSADVEGLQFWKSKIAESGFSYSPRAGDGLTDQERPLYDRIVVDFGNSPESQQLYAGKSAKQSADVVYGYCFGRAAEIDPLTGFNYWVNKLEKNEISLSQLAAEVVLGAQERDLDYIRNKTISASIFYQAMDSSEEQLGYGGNADALLAREWLAQFGQSVATLQQANLILTQILDAA